MASVFPSAPRSSGQHCPLAVEAGIAEPPGRGAWEGARSRAAELQESAGSAGSGPSADSATHSSSYVPTAGPFLRKFAACTEIRPRPGHPTLRSLRGSSASCKALASLYSTARCSSRSEAGPANPTSPWESHRLPSFGLCNTSVCSASRCWRGLCRHADKAVPPAGQETHWPVTAQCPLPAGEGGPSPALCTIPPLSSGLGAKRALLLECCPPSLACSPSIITPPGSFLGPLRPWPGHPQLHIREAPGRLQGRGLNTGLTQTWKPEQHT